MKTFPTFLFLFLLSFNLLAQNTDEENILKLVREGYELHDKADYKGAIEKYKEALDIDSKSFLANAEIAITYYRTEQYSEAIKHCKKAIKHNKKNKNLSNVYVTYGNSLDLMGKAKKSIKIYKEGIKKFPDEPMLHFNFGITLTNNNKMEEALKSFQKSAKLNPYHASSHYVQSLVASDLRMKVPSILAGWRFLILEPTGERAKVIQQGITNVLRGSAKKTGENETHISLDLFSKGEGAENDFSAIDLMIGLGSAMDLSKEEEAKEETVQQKTQKKLKMIWGMLVDSDKQSKKGFYWSYYSPYFAAMDKAGFAETFSYLFLVSTNESDIQKWMEENGEKIDEFYKWSEAYEWD